MYTIRHSEAKAFYYVQLSNKVNHRDILSFLEKICDIHATGESLMILTDYRDAEIDETSTEPIKKIANFFNSHIRTSCGQVIWSNVASSYLPTTGAIILQDMIQGGNVNYHPFSTIEAALVWMGLDKSDLDTGELMAESN